MKTIKYYTGSFTQRCDAAIADMQQRLGLDRYVSVSEYLVRRLIASKSLSSATHHARFTLNSIAFLQGIEGFPLRAFLHDAIGRVRRLTGKEKGGAK